MTKEEILHLGTLSRIQLSEAETGKLQAEIEAILQYVSQVNSLAADGHLGKEVGPVHNVFRDDVVANQPGQYSQDLTEAFPERSGRHLKVKKILNPDS